MEETVKQPTKAQVEVLKSDWLGNLRQKNYIRKNTKGSIVKNLDENESLTQYAFGDFSDMTQEDLMKCARDVAQNMVNSVTDKNIDVRVGSDDSFCGVDESGHMRINVATKHFDEVGLSANQKMEIFNGFAIHEACHANHTDLKNRFTETSQENILKNNLMNILEDERIELLLGESTENGGDGMPGLADYLGKTKEYCFGKFEKQKEETCGELKERIPRFINTILKAVRYPSALTEEEILENFDSIDKVRRILTPFPKTCPAVRKAAEDIVSVMKEMIDEDNRKQQEQQKQQKEQGQQKQQENSSESSDDKSPSGNNTSNSTKNDSKNTESQGAQPQTLEEALNTKEALALKDAMEKNAKISESSQGNNSMALTRENKGYINGTDEKSSGLNGEDIYLHKIKGDENSRSKYRMSLNKVRKYIPAMAKALRCKTEERDFILYGEKSGKLNTNHLVALKTGNPNIFSKKGSVTKDSACICILIDESGSMRNECRIDRAREAAILVNEAVKNIPNLELFTYGFGNRLLNIYCERNTSGKWALGDVHQFGDTPTAMAMKVSSERIRKMTDSQCLMLIITDGLPNSTSDTRQQDKALRKKGFLPVGIDIAGSDNVRGVFDDAIVVNDLNNLAPKIGELVRKKLQKNIQSHENY